MKNGKKIQALVTAATAVLLAYSCTSSLFVVKGQRNTIKTEQNVNADSTSVSINNQK